MKQNKIGFSNYILKRKKIFIASFMFVPIIKILAHYSMFAERYPLNTPLFYQKNFYQSRDYNSEYYNSITPSFLEIPGNKKPILDHLELVFHIDGKLELYIPLFLLNIFVWFLNYKLCNISS